MASSPYVHINDVLPPKEGQVYNDYDPYKAIAAAACLQAFDDLKSRYSGKDWSDGPLPEQDTLEKFFRSDLYKLYSGKDNGEAVIRMAKFRGEYEAFRYDHHCKSCAKTPKQCIHRDGKAWDKIEEIDIFCPGRYAKKKKKHGKEEAAKEVAG